MINDDMRGALRYTSNCMQACIDDTFCPFNHVIELQEMCKQNKKYIKYQTI